MSGDIVLSQREARALIYAIDRYRSNPPSWHHPAFLSPTERDALQTNIARTYLDPDAQGTEDAQDATEEE